MVEESGLRGNRRGDKLSKLELFWVNWIERRKDEVFFFLVVWGNSHRERERERERRGEKPYGGRSRLVVRIL